MDKLFAPWRIKYIKAKKQKGCIFCSATSFKTAHFVISKTKYSLAMLNIFPYNNGHVMVCPLRHVKDFSLLCDDEIIDLLRLLNKTKQLLDKVLKPQGYNIGINISACAGSGLPGHLHIHIVPRWRGDTNFMPVLYDTKIISQSLGELYKRLRNAKRKSG